MNKINGTVAMHNYLKEIQPSNYSASISTQYPSHTALWKRMASKSCLAASPPCCYASSAKLGISC